MSSTNSTTPDTIAAALNETEPVPLKTIARLVEVMGEEYALALLADTLALEAGEGLLTKTGQRRTPGGVYFKLAKDRLSSPERKQVFGVPPKRKADTAKQPAVSLDWPALLPVVTELLANPPHGEADKMKLTLIGKPGKIIEKGEVVMTTLVSPKAPSLPKGLPAPPTELTTTVVFIAAKQWRKVQPALAADPTDRVIVEGYPALDKRIGGGTLCLYAQSVTTTGLQKAKFAADKPG
jgi:hypothetical protein